MAEIILKSGRVVHTGAKASPRHKLAGAEPHKATAYPPSFAALARQLSYWGNNRYGDCVSAEEASARASQSSRELNTPEIFVAEADLIQWADQHGFLNGADLTTVMEAAAQDGLPFNSVAYLDGPYNSVNWEDYPTLCSAISQGPVKIGVASGQIQDAAGNNNGWWMTSARKDTNIDHCVGLVGYGTAAECAAFLGSTVPGGVDPTTPCVIMFTWDTYGIVAFSALTAITGEAWLRTTTLSTGQVPTPPPGPLPPPAPVPPQPPDPGPGPQPRPPSRRLVKLAHHVSERWEGNRDLQAKVDAELTRLEELFLE